MELLPMEGPNHVTSYQVPPDVRTQISLANHQGLLTWHRHRLNLAHSAALKAYGRIVMVSALIPLLTVVIGLPITWWAPEIYGVIHNQCLPSALVTWLVIVLVLAPLWIILRHVNGIILPIHKDILESETAIQLLLKRKVS